MNFVEEDKARVNAFRQATEALLKTPITDEFFEEVILQQRLMDEEIKIAKIRALVELCEKRGVPVPDDLREYTGKTK